VPYLTGKRSGNPHETLFWRQGGRAGLCHGDLKLVRMGGRKDVGNAKWELYDLSKDISEETNLAKANPERLAELVAIWEKMNGEMREPMF
jgi:arylsulfatase A-like enzyme